MEIPNSDILLKNVDIPLLRKQYEYLLVQESAVTDEVQGILNLLEFILDEAENQNAQK